MSNQNDIIVDVFSNVIENLAFMFSDPLELDDIPEDVSDGVLATIEFKGAAEGRLLILTTQALSIELAANLLGVEPDDEDADVQSLDALGELANVTLGRLLTELKGAEPVFDLTKPRVEVLADTQQWQALRNADDTVRLSVDGNPVMMQLLPAAA